VRCLAPLLIVFVCIGTASAAERAPLYAGGMMASGGSIAMQDAFSDMEGLYMGVGGRLYFMTGGGFRIGIMGGVGRMRYGNDASRFQYSHSALSAEWGLTIQRFSIAAGITGGRAKYYILDKLSVDGAGIITAREYQKAVPVFSPILSLEFAISARLRIATVIDYPFMHIEDRRHSGLRIGAGMLFVK
jgi:hypothetical protein